MGINHKKLLQKLSGLPYFPIYFFPKTTSTNDIAASLATGGAPHLTLVVADEQTAGRGRSNRKWYTPPGSALAFSVILRPGETRFVSRYNAVAALSLCQVFRHDFNLDAKIKWPNDVLLNNRKVAGVLVEPQWQGDELRSIILGVGVNVTMKAIPPEAALDFPAVSLEDEASRQVNRLELLYQVLAQISMWLPKIGDEDFINRWQDWLEWLGERVWVLSKEGLPMYQGLVVGLDDDGGLILELSPGNKRTIYTSELRLRLVN